MRPPNSAPRGFSKKKKRRPNARPRNYRVQSDLKWKARDEQLAATAPPPRPAHGQPQTPE